MKFTLKCADWKVKVDDKWVDYTHSNIFYHTKLTEESLNKEIEINSIEDLQKLVEEYDGQWKEEPYTSDKNNKYYCEKDRSIIINFDKKEITIYNSYIE